MKPKQPKRKDPKPNEVSGKVEESQTFSLDVTKLNRLNLFNCLGDDKINELDFSTYTKNNLINNYYRTFEGKEYSIHFDKEAIKKVYDKFMKDGKD